MCARFFSIAVLFGTGLVPEQVAWSELGCPPRCVSIVGKQVTRHLTEDLFEEGVRTLLEGQDPTCIVVESALQLSGAKKRSWACFYFAPGPECQVRMQNRRQHKARKMCVARMKTKGPIWLSSHGRREGGWQNLQRGAAASEARKQSHLKKTGWISGHRAMSNNYDPPRRSLDQIALSLSQVGCC